MMAGFAPYPHYKDSGLPWVGWIPGHWQTAHLRYVSRIGNGATPSRDRADYWENGTVPWLNSGQVNDYIVRQARQFITPVAQQAASLRLWPKGSIILGLYGQGKTRGTSAYLNIDAAINQALAGITPNHELNGRFLHYTLIAGREHLRQEGRGGSQPNLNCAIIGGFPVLLPPLEEQNGIVAYLRTQDAKIARFIRIKRELIARLHEQKLRLIDHAITGGLDNSGRRKLSGVAWLGEVPGHWNACKLKYVATFNPSRIESSSMLQENMQVSFLPMKCITTYGELQNIELKKISEIWNGFTYFRRNDVVLAKITPCFENGKSGVLDTLPTEIGFGTTEFIVLRAMPEKILPAFLAKLLSLKQFLVLGSEAMTGAAGQQRVPLDFVKNFTIPLPPLEEQKTLLAHITANTEPLTKAITQAEAEITLIREYRERLILDAVTGQIDLRGWQAAADTTLAEDNLAAWVDDDADADTEEETRDDSE